MAAARGDPHHRGQPRQPHRRRVPENPGHPAALAGTGAELSVTSSYVALDAADPDALEKLRNAVNRIDPAASVSPIPARPLAGTLRTVQQSVQVGAVALLLVAGASLPVSVVEQLRERRRLLAALVAMGTPRSTLGGSILHQVGVSVVLGLPRRTSSACPVAAGRENPWPWATVAR